MSRVAHGPCVWIDYEWDAYLARSVFNVKCYCVVAAEIKKRMGGAEAGVASFNENAVERPLGANGVVTVLQGVDRNACI